MVTSTPEAGDKSLLLQTVALFETLLAKIHDLQGQNEKMRARLPDEVEGGYDALVLELESARKDIQVKKQKVPDLINSNQQKISKSDARGR